VIIAMTAAGTGMVLLCVLGFMLARIGSRTGDRKEDATVAAWLCAASQPDENRPVVRVRVRNPSGGAVIAGFSVRRQRVPDWLSGGGSVSVPLRTTRRRFGAAAHDVVGVVAAGESAEFTVPARTSARRYRLTAVLGQGAGRLRVIRMPVSDRGEPGATLSFRSLDEYFS
jgi:hypothetical protein